MQNRRHYVAEISKLLSEKAAKAFAELEELYKERSTALTASALLLIAGSYHMCRDRAQRVSHVESLTGALRSSSAAPNEDPGIMLLGSPVYAPNYKVLFAIEERIHIIWQKAHHYMYAGPG